jgi:hypothetical protein
MHCMQERTRRGGLCFCASARIQVAAVLTHANTVRRIVVLKCPTFLRRLAFRYY